MRLGAVLEAWSGLAQGPPLPGGNRNEVLAGSIAGRQVVIRHSSRGEESLHWEFDLLSHLRSRGCLVPELIPADDGRLHLSGWHVQELLPGRPATCEDGSAVRKALARVHELTRSWAQRPGAVSASKLLTAWHGGDIDLSAMPDPLVAEIRRSWQAVKPAESCVVHGDAGGMNALIAPDGSCALIDWDEARVDDPLFDVPAGPREERAALAWEVATCWMREPGYAKRLAVTFMAG
jgi:putative phosphotransferase enzyme family